MNKILSGDFNIYLQYKKHFPKTGSYVLCTHYWFEYKTCKTQYFFGKCFSTRNKGILSSIKLRTFCYKTIMEVFIFINSPTLSFVYSFVRDSFNRKMSIVFLRKDRKSKKTKNQKL